MTPIGINTMATAKDIVIQIRAEYQPPSYDGISRSMELTNRLRSVCSTQEEYIELLNKAVDTYLESLEYFYQMKVAGKPIE